MSWAGVETQFGEVWSVSIGDPAGPRRLTEMPGPRSSDNPAWSPDGQWILFDTNRGVDQAEIWIMVSNGSGARPLIAASCPVSWQPVTLATAASGGPDTDRRRRAGRRDALERRRREHGDGRRLAVHVPARDPGDDTGTVVAERTATVTAGSFVQLDRFLAGTGTTRGSVRITKTSGANPYVAYGIRNDGADPGQRTGDGAHVEASAQ